MKTFPGPLAAHYAQDATTLCHVWRLTLRDASVYRFARHMLDVVVGAETFSAANVKDATALEFGNGFEADNMQIELLLDGTTLTANDLRSGRWSNALVEILEVNYADTSMGSQVVRRGRLGEIKLTRTSAVLEVRPLSAQLAQKIGRLYLPACDADLGDFRCTVNLAAFTDGIVTGVAVTSVVSRRQFTCSSLAQAADWFKAGLATFTSGANLGVPQAEVKTHAAGGAITLHLPMPFTVAVSDVLTLQVGCQKRYDQDCVAKFANGVNHQGFRHLPGRDTLTSLRV